MHTYDIQDSSVQPAPQLITRPFIAGDAIKCIIVGYGQLGVLYAVTLQYYIAIIERPGVVLCCWLHVVLRSSQAFPKYIAHTSTHQLSQVPMNRQRCKCINQMVQSTFFLV